jgi:hypothetical protein
MHIPLDNLYNWIAGLLPSTVIYRFYPNGSKKLIDLDQADDRTSKWPWRDVITAVPVICHDQEPLDYNMYNSLTWQVVRELHQTKWPDSFFYHDEFTNQSFWERRAQLNVAAMVHATINDKFVLLHSEKRSQQIEKYQQARFVPAYWWSHAMIAQDWYRFAKHDTRLKLNTDHSFKYNFNIYARAWSGSREYRLSFLQLLVNKQLDINSRVTFNDHDHNCHYTAFKFVNPALDTVNDLSTLPVSKVSSCQSGDYDTNHYNECAVDVVLETLFDDTRLHLTEKVLRPIACGKPFILAATSGSLEYLRSYGFRTFAPAINEHYDTISDPVQRLAAIIAEMSRINNLPQDQKQQLWQELHSIAQHNQAHFFSAEFTSTVVEELKQNLCRAVAEVNQNWQTGRLFIANRRGLDRVQKDKLNLLAQQYVSDYRSDLADALRQGRSRRS